jgi:hypothetical protein
LTAGFAFGAAFGFATTFGFTTALDLTTGFFFGAGFTFPASFFLPLGFTLEVVLPRKPARAFSAKRTLAIMMVLSSAAVLGGRFERRVLLLSPISIWQSFLDGFQCLILYGFWRVV